MFQSIPSGRGIAYWLLSVEGHLFVGHVPFCCDWMLTCVDIPCLCETDVADPSNIIGPKKSLSPITFKP